MWYVCICLRWCVFFTTSFKWPWMLRRVMVFRDANSKREQSCLTVVGTHICTYILCTCVHAHTKIYNCIWEEFPDSIWCFFLGCWLERFWSIGFRLVSNIHIIWWLKPVVFVVFYTVIPDFLAPSLSIRIRRQDKG